MCWFKPFSPGGDNALPCIQGLCLPPKNAFKVALEDAKAKAADEFGISVERRRAIPFESTPRPLRNTYSSALQLYSSESQRWERWERWETLNGEE